MGDQVLGEKALRISGYLVDKVVVLLQRPCSLN